jgi:5-oxoprolinase (ATP-hydrolysing)
MKLLGKGDTTVVDAYLLPILHRYIDRVLSQLPDVKLMFMKSDRGLVNVDQFHGKDSILLGPTGGIIETVKTSLMAGFKEIITFNMEELLLMLLTSMGKMKDRLIMKLPRPELEFLC